MIFEFKSRLSYNAATFAFVLMFAVTFVCLPGCGGSENSATGNSGGNDPSANSNENGSPNANGGKTSGDGTLNVDKDGNRWVGDVPFDVYDVFFDEPLQVAQDSQLVATSNSNTGMNVSTPPANNGNNAGANTTTNTQDPMPMSTGGGSVKWEDLVTTEILLDETKKLRNELTTTLRSVGTYNRDFKTVQFRGATLATVAQILIEHPGDVTWKENAKYVRVLATEMANGAESTGRANYEKAQIPFEKIGVILSGSTPPELPEAEDQAAFGEFGDIAMLMSRIKNAEAFMRLNVQNTDDLKSKAKDVLHEAAMLAAVTQSLGDSEYVYASEENYQKFVKQMVTACQETMTAIKTENLEAFQAGIKAINKSCSECHNEYQFE